MRPECIKDTLESKADNSSMVVGDLQGGEVVFPPSFLV
jgi:hypothetical protein